MTDARQELNSDARFRRWLFKRWGKFLGACVELSKYDGGEMHLHPIKPPTFTEEGVVIDGAHHRLEDIKELRVTRYWHIRWLNLTKRVESTFTPVLDIRSVEGKLPVDE